MSPVEPVWTDRRAVADLMLRNPKTLPGDASVADGPPAEVDPPAE